MKPQMLHAVLIPANPDKGIALFDYPANDGLEAWKRVVRDSDPTHSRLFDVVAVPDFDVWVDDEDLFVNQPKANIRLMVLLSEYGELVQPVVGDAIITGGPDREGATTDLKPEVVAKILHATVP